MATLLRVLLVEDDEADALLLLRALKKGGYDVTHTRVQTEADMRAELARAEWDIIISDYVLPDFSGAQALQVLKASGLKLPFILVSGLIPAEIAVEVVKSSADDYVSKDRLERLVPSVQSALAQAQRRREAAQVFSTATVQPQWIFGIRARLVSGFAAVALLVGLVGGLSVYQRYGEAEPHARAIAEQMARAIAIGIHELGETIGAKDVFLDDPSRIQTMIDETFRS